MKRFTILLIIALLTFSAGVFANKAWERRQNIINACVDLALNYQD
jgi:hypothetical protein